ncbi:hypothetical protein ICN49_11190 [Polynucleobacter sp. MWH-Mekk-B1]|jgi:hypothetical protein|uniref:hypothetical protein n=1 Tax=Polynucleobacter finlandensis TaxID=1855894 RepID=UPI001C0B2969|nr:hypothetical protein [Polynucleobacter finlandensis]MBU3545484.1 hypothetical protein [Polynucleobacter finlandensis]
MPLEERIFFALSDVVPSKSSQFFADLEKLSGIKAGSWRHAYYGQQRATCDMIEFTCRYVPHYAYWIVTGAAPEDGMENLVPGQKVLDVAVLEKIVSKEPIDWTTEEVEIVVSNLFGDKKIHPTLIRLMSNGMDARERKKLLNVKSLNLPNIIMKEPDLWTTTEINYLLFKRYQDPKDESSYEDFVKANLGPNDDLNLDLIARQEEKIAFVVEGAAFMND